MTVEPFFEFRDLIGIGISVALAAIPSIVAWIRLGPRVDTLEQMLKEHSSDIKSSAACLIRLTALQEVAERRLERLESAPLKR